MAQAYMIPLPEHAVCMQLNPKVPKHTPGINPATWVLTTTSLGMMKKLGTNYAMAYAKSSLNKYDFHPLVL